MYGVDFVGFNVADLCLLSALMCGGGGGGGGIVGIENGGKRCELY